MSCRRLYDPATLTLAATAVTAVGAATGAVVQGISAERAADAQAADLKAQAQFAEVQANRAARDEKEEQARRRARIIALASARGNVGTSALVRSESESALRIQRIRDDALLQARGLRAQASNVREAGDFARGQSIFSAGTELVGAGLGAGAEFRKARRSGGGVSASGLAGDVASISAPGG